MTDQPKALLAQFAQNCTLAAPTIRRRQQSKDGTVKYLLQLADGNCIETVLMRYHHGNTVCISSQVGCRMGCAFCASTLGGKVRDLTPAEMLDQVLFTGLDSGVPISNIVLMGIGSRWTILTRYCGFWNWSPPEGSTSACVTCSLSTCGLADQIDNWPIISYN